MAYRRKERDLSVRDVTFLQKNTLPHTAALSQQPLEQCGKKLLESTLYSPNLSMCDFHVFDPPKQNQR